MTLRMLLNHSEGIADAIENTKLREEIYPGSHGAITAFDMFAKAWDVVKPR
jgi:actin-related protein